MTRAHEENGSVARRQHIWLILLVVAGVASTVPLSAQAATYYVDQSHPVANDSNPGTEPLPWLTMYAINTAPLAPGDTVYVKAGTYSVPSGGSWTTPAIAPAQAGTASAPITVASYPGHTVIVDGGSNVSNAVMGARTSYVTVRGFIIRNAGGWCINAAGSGRSARILGVLIEGNECSGITGTGVNNSSGLRFFHIESSTVRNNVFHNDPIIGDNANVAGIFLEDGRNNIIENNEVYSFRTGIFDKYAVQENNIFRRNYIHDVVGAGILFSCFGETGTDFCQSGQVYENIVTNSRDGIVVGQTFGSTNFRNFIVYNNTLYNVADAGIMSGGASTNFRNWNNIVWITGTRGALEVGGLTQSDYSNFYPRERFSLYTSPTTQTTYSSLSSWRTGTGFDLNSLTTDPLFVGPLTGTPPPTAFQLLIGSPLPGAGRVGGVSTGAAVNMGAYTTGTEVIGPTNRDTVAPAPPTGLLVR